MVRSVRFAWIPLLAAIAAGCKDVPFAPPEYPDSLTVVTKDAWSGGPVTVRSPLFLAWPDAPVLVGTSQVTAVVIDSMTRQITFEGNGPQTVSLLRPDDAVVPLGTVHLYGYRDSYDGPRFNGYPVLLPGGQPEFLANGTTSLVRVNLRTNLVYEYPASMHHPWCARGPGPTMSPTRFILGPPGCRKYQVWDLTGLPYLVTDSVPGSNRISAQLSPPHWLRADAHRICLEPSVLGDCRRYEEPNGFVFSPRRDRVFIYRGYAPGGMPVFSTTTGDTAFSVDEEPRSAGGAFTGDGDTLWLAGSGNKNQLFVLDPLTGVHYAAIQLNGEPEDIALDPLRDFVYVLSWNVRAVGIVAMAFPEISVIDRGSRGIVARLFAPAASIQAQAPLCYYCLNRLVLDPYDRVLYVVASGLDGPAWRNVPVARFDLIP